MKTNLQDYNGRKNIGEGVRWDCAGQSFHEGQPPQPTYLDAIIDFETLAEAKEFAAKFPKFVKVTATGLGTYDVVDGQYVSYDIAIAGLRINLYPNKTTGAINEGGLKRFKAFMATCAKLGIKVTRVYNWKNSIEY